MQGRFLLRQQTEAAELAERYAREFSQLPGGPARARPGRERVSWRNGIAASSAGSARTNCAPGWRRWPAPTATGPCRDSFARARAAEAVGLIDGLSADLAFNPGELLAVQALLFASTGWRSADRQLGCSGLAHHYLVDDRQRASHHFRVTDDDGDELTRSQVAPGGLVDLVPWS